MICFRNRLMRLPICCLVFAVACLICFPGYAQDSLTVDGKTVKLIGSGNRSFLFIDIYKLSAYSESGNCSPTPIVYNNEVKSMRLKMLRDIPIDRLTSNLRSTFEANIPEKGDQTVLRNKIDNFLSRFKNDLKSGANVEINYAPGKGTTIIENGKQLGASVPGKDFAELVWRSYFGSKTCCSSLKAAIIKECNKN